MRSAHRAFASYAVLIAALLGAPAATAQGSAPRIFGATVATQVLPRASDALVVQSRNVRPDLAAIERLAQSHLATGARTRFVLDLLPGFEFEAEVMSAEVRRSGTTVFARLTGTALGSALLTYESGVLVGSVSLPGANYVVERVADGLYRVARVAAERVRPEVPPIAVPTPPLAEEPRTPPDIPADSGRLIDVMVLWTPAAEMNAGGLAQMQAIVQGGIDNANLVYLNSGVAQRLRLVHSEQIAYTERTAPPGCTDAFACALNDITGTSDGIMDGVHAMRDTHGADLVSLLIHDQALCGLAWMPQPPAANTSNLGFSVTAHDCVLPPARAFTHELGHNMGSDHDPFVVAAGTCADGKQPGAFCFSRGLVNLAGGWRTIMAYDNQCTSAVPAVDCPHIDFLSNPNLAHLGAPLGTAASSNNAHSHNKTAKIIASYRPTATALHPIPERFGDVPLAHVFFGYIEFFGQAGVTTGCGGGLFCPEGTVTRRAMAAFLERVKRASNWAPPAAVGRFDDVPVADAFAPWVEALATDGITSGCSATPSLFCPDNPVTRGQMAVFILRASCGPTYVPNTPATQRFDDVPPTHAFYAFIDKLAALGVTGGCSTTPALYCPETPVTRGQMAVFVERAYPALTPSEFCTL